MVCKKYQVYDWFRTLDGAKRIDFLNGMLHLCFPLELRFLGSCIEELARKDYTYLRDAEIKANAAFEIQLMRDITDKVTRSKMIVTLALLASSNHECARLIYDLLNVDILDMLEKMKLSLDEKIADEFLLLLTMAANHPAFDFQMKTKMSQLYLNAELKLKQSKIILKESESDLCLYNNAQDDSATLQSKTSSSKLNEETKNENETKIKEDNQSDKMKLESEITKEPLIESIDFEGVQMIQGTDNYKFLIKIRWSDKGFNVIDKTYSELCEFNKQLNNLYPKEMSGIETSQLVFKENQKEDVVKELPLVTDYCSKIASLPKLVCESEFLRSFFRSNLSNSSITIANDSNSPNRLINTTINTPRSPPPLLNIAQQNVAKNVDENANKIINKSESPNHLEDKIENLKISESAPKSEDTTIEAKKLANQQATKAKIDRTVVSVSQALSANASNQRTEQTLPPQHHQYNSRPNNTSNNQMINYSQQPIPPFHHSNSLFQPQHYLNMNQPLHLQTFQSNQNMIISSPPCQSPSAISSSAPTASQLATNSTGINPQSTNNSRSNSPWSMMPPPPLPSLIQQQAMINNNAQFYPPYFMNYNQNNNHHFRSNSNNSNKSSSNFKDSKHQNYNMHHPMMSSHEDLLLRCALDNNVHLNMPPQMMPPSAPYDENANYFNENISNKQPHHNNRSNKSSSDLKKNSSKSKTAQNQSTNDSLLTTTTNNQQNCNETANNNGTMSPKLSNNNSNPKPLSSNLNSTQSFPISLSLPLHLQQQHKQQMLSPQNNQPPVVMGGFNPTQMGTNYPQPNPNLINNQLIAIPQQTPANQQGNNTFLLTPLIQQTSVVYGPASLPPTHPTSLALQQSHQPNTKYQSKQNRQNAERPRSPNSSNLTSDEENNDKKSSNRRSSSINSGQRVHRKMSSSSSSSTNNNGNNQNSKYSFSRQHNSHSISSTTTTIKPSSVSNASSNSSLNSNNNRVSGSNNSLSASPSNQQQPNAQIVSPVNSKNINKTNKVVTNTEPILSPKSLNLKQMKQQNQVVSPVDGNKEDKNSEDNKTKNEQSEIKERNNINTNGQYSSSSSSSSISTVTLINNNNVPNKSQHISNLIPIPPPAQPSQASSLSTSSTINNNNMFFSPVVPPFTYIDGGNIYTLTNGLNPNLPPSVNHSMVPSAINPFNPYQQSSLPPPQSSNSFQHHHHQSNANNYLIQPQHQPYYNLIPMMQSNPPINLVQQPNGQQPYQLQNQTQQQPNSNNNNNNNFATPTPGSSPNPTISSSSSSSSSNLNGNQHQQQPPPYSIEQQLLNPYSFNMMALANAVANSSNGQPINHNMVMMMMMQNQQPPYQPPPILPNQLQPTQMMNNNKYNYQHYQPYRSQTPNSLQQPSPSSNLINSTTSSRSNQQHNINKKKISCYNCGLMNHTAKDCDQPTLETISQPTQYRLSFKSNNQNQNGPTTSSSHLNTQSQVENSDETLVSKNLNSPNDYEYTKNGISVTTNGAANSTSSTSASSSASTSSLASNSLKKTFTNIVSPDSTSTANFK